MMAERFPDFKFTHDWKGDVDVLGLRIYGFVRERTDYWYDYLPIGRRFDEDEEGHLSIDTWLGVGCAPWYEWNYTSRRGGQRVTQDGCRLTKGLPDHVPCLVFGVMTAIN